MAMNKQRRTSNINNIVTYNTLGSVTLPADLTIKGLTSAGFVKTDANGLLSVDTGAYLPFPSQTGNAGKFLKTNGSVISWADVPADINIYANDGTLTGNRTVTMGGYTLSFEKDIKVNSLVIGKANGNFENTIVGITNTSGSKNTAFGYYSLNNTTGIANTSLGYAALQANIGNSYNTAVGSNALYFATATGNTAIGINALQAITTGGYNIAIGYRAGQYISGFASTNQLSTYSIYIGTDSKANSNGVTNEIAIGYNVNGLGSNTTIIGNSSTVTAAIYGRLLLGTTTDSGSYQLDVQGTGRFTGDVQFGSTAYIGNVVGAKMTTSPVTSNDAYFTFYGAGTSQRIGASFIHRSDSRGLVVQNSIGGTSSIELYSGTSPAIVINGNGINIQSSTSNPLYRNIIGTTGGPVTLNSAGNSFVIVSKTADYADLSFVGSGSFWIGGNGYPSGNNVKTYYFGGGMDGITNTQAERSVTFHATYPSSSLIDEAGGHFTISGGRGTGTGTSGDVIFSTATPTTTGTTLQILSQRWWVKGSSGTLANVSSPSISAILQADSTTKGFLQPRMTTTERNAIVSPATGLSIYNTTTNTNDYYNGTAWVTLNTSISDGGTYTPTITNVTNASSSSLNTNSFRYVRIGNSVHVSGWLAISATAANSLTEVELTFPIASNTGSNADVSGVATTLNSGYGQVRENTVTDRAKLYLYPTSTGSLVWNVAFSYTLI